MKVTPPGAALGEESVLHAGDLFVDRNSEAESFAQALTAFRQLIDSDDESEVARRNLLTFHGVGGIGKTTLSTRLEAWTNGTLPPDNEWGPPPAAKVAATARIDLHGSAGQVDFAAALMALRSGVASIQRSWPVFDLAFAAYWSAVRPGEPLPRIRGRDELGTAVAETVGDVLSDLGSLAALTGAGTGTGLGIRAVRSLIGTLRRRHAMRLAIGAFEGFEGFLMRCADEPSPANAHPMLVCDIAGTLAWELSRIAPTPLVVVFVDTTERLALDARRVAEGYLNALVYRLPNVLFVMTGRNALNWHDQRRSDLPYRGPWAWPGLLPTCSDEPRQHLVQGLSALDARTLVCRGRDQLGLPITDRVIDDLVEAASGLPQYLELARELAVALKSAGDGRQLTAADVTGSLASLVTRVLDDIPEDERCAVRAAALFRKFDINLLAAAADVDWGTAERAVRRPMIDDSLDDRFPYRMHDAIRNAIRNADHLLAGGWSARDWQAASSRAARAAQEMHDLAKTQGATREVLDAIGVAISLVCDQNTILEPPPSPPYDDWLTRAIVYGPSVQGLRSRLPTMSKTEYGQHILDFVAAKSLDTPIEERIRLLRKIFDSDHPLRLPAGRHLGYTLKLQHRWDDALAVFDEVVQLSPTPVNIRQGPQVLALSRRFADALEVAAGTPGEAQIRRMVEYAHGLPERYFNEIPETILMLQQAGRHREYLEEKGDLLIRQAFFHGDVLQAAEILTYQDEVELAGHNVGIRSALLATILHRVGTADGIALSVERLKYLDQMSGATGAIGFRYAFAELCDALVTDSVDRLARLHEECQRVDFRTRSWIPIECFLAREDLPVEPTSTQWLEPEGVVNRRWCDHLDRYLARVSSATPRRG